MASDCARVRGLFLPRGSSEAIRQRGHGQVVPLSGQWSLGRVSSPSLGLGDTPRLGAERWGARQVRLRRATGAAETYRQRRRVRIRFQSSCHVRGRLTGGLSWYWTEDGGNTRASHEQGRPSIR
eukprot:1629017-Pleurochrysis_carterae.AAC.1